jgi:hypothetical protein
MFNKPKDAEVDVENLKVTAVERRGKETVVITEGSADDEIWLRCTLEKHNDIVARFRKKLGLNESL